MTTDNESVRKDFEAKFPVPEGIIKWDAATNRYAHPTHRISMVADQYNQLLSVWQASRERYEQHQIAEVHKNSAGQIILRNMDGSTFDISKHVGYVLVPATPNGGNE